MARAATWIAVDPVHQFTDGVAAITRHIGRLTTRRCHQLVANHQQAIVVAGNVALKQDFFAEFGSGCVSCFQLLARRNVDGHALALIAILGLDHHRQADFASGGPGVFGGVHLASHRDWHTCG